MESGQREGTSAQADPRLVDKLVEELKSQGMFDQIRKDCLAEVDTKPAYQNLRSRVEDTVSRYLARQSRNWSPSVNKNQLRNQLRRHIQESKYMEDGVERIVDQVVNPKILSAIQPGVESIICNYLGIDKIEDGQEEDAENGNMDPMAVDRFASPLPASRDTKHRRESITEKLSNVSSEDIEMRSTGESCDEKKQPKPPTSDASSPGLGPRRNVSPLTPDLKSNSEGRSPDLRGNVSPLTPPPLPPPPPPGEASSSRSPQTPPLPPSLRQEEEEESMSPVSDTELADISPPDQSPETPNDNDFPSPPQNDFMVPPPPPPLPSYMPLPPPLPASIEGPSAPRTPPPLPPPPPDLSSSAAGRPPSPFTSPIGSSSDELDIPEPPPPQTATPYVRAVPSASSVSASDISDTDLPASSQSDGEKETVESDLEALEAERVKLRAQLERAKIESEFEDGQADSSECDVQSSDSDAKAAKSKVVASQRVDVAAAAAAEPESLPLLDSGASPISSTDQSSTPPEAERIDDHEEEKAKFRQGKDDSDNDDDDGWKGSGGRLPSSETLASSGSSAKGDKGSEVKKENGGSSAAVGKTASTGSDKSRHRTSSSSHRSHHRRQDSRPKDRKRSSSSKSSKQHRSESKSAVVPDVANSAEEALKQRKEKCFADCAKKDEKKEKEKRRSEKYGKMEEKVSKADKLKSDKFQSFDMFAPKPKPKPHVSRPSSSASSASLSSSLSSPSALGLVTPPTFGSKTPPSFGHKNHQPKSVSSAAPPKKDDVNHHQQPPPGVKCEKPLNRSVADAKQLMKREKVARLELLEPQRKVFPELPVSRIEGDKLKQHEDDYLAAKRNLQRKREELIQQKELEKLQTKRKSGSFSEEHGRQRRKSFVDEDLGSSPREPRRKSVSSRKSHSTDDSDVERRDGGKQRPTKEPENATAVSRRSRRVKHGFCNDEENSDENSATEQDNLEQRMEEILGQQPDEVLTPAAPPTPSKSRWENEADNLLKSDRETKQLLGFDDDDLVGLPRSTLLFDYLLRAADSLAHVSLSQEEEDEMIETIPFVCSDDFIYLDNLSEVRGGNQKLVQILKRFGGNPKLVQPVPQWLQSKLARWKLKRHEVELIYTPATVRKRKGFVTEAEYDVRYPELVEPQDKKLKYDDDDDGNESSGQLLDTPSHESQSDGGEEGDKKAVPEDDVMEAAAQQENQEKISDGFHGFTTRDVNRNVTSILIKDSHEEDVDSNGNTFGMIPQQHVNFERDVTVKDHDDDDDRFRFMSVAMSSSLVDHMKILLEGEEGDWKKSLELLSTAHEDRTVLKESEGSSSGSEFNLPPSPISCPSSNYSEKSTNSPLIKESSSRPNGKGEVEKSQVPLAPASIERVVERYSNFCT